jgi:hypothetical protein
MDATGTTTRDHGRHHHAVLAAPMITVRLGGVVHDHEGWTPKAGGQGRT